MDKLLHYHIQINAALETAFKQMRRQLLSWGETHTVPELDARTQYDIGENDCRPPQAKPAKTYSSSFEAMLNRSI